MKEKRYICLEIKYDKKDKNTKIMINKDTYIKCHSMTMGSNGILYLNKPVFICKDKKKEISELLYQIIKQLKD